MPQSDPTTQLSSNALLAVARLAAARAGDHARDNLSRRDDVNTITRDDVKHKLDVECETIATQIILTACPDHAILAEESAGAEKPAPTGAEWIIDPIDGTVNFFHGLPYWCCSVAVRCNGVMQAGVVYAPELGLTFEATIDGPALCNNRRIHCSKCTEAEYALVNTGCDKAEDPAHSCRFFNALGNLVQRPRIMGAAALDVCMVAQGASDGYFEHGIFIWDIAAASLILERAGGTHEVLRRHGGYRLAFLASNGHLHEQLKRCLLAVCQRDCG